MGKKDDIALGKILRKFLRGDGYAHISDSALCIDGYVWHLSQKEIALLKLYGVREV